MVISFEIANFAIIVPILDNRFKDKSRTNYLIPADSCHTKDMIELARESARECGIELMDGCYSYWPLPQFESAADI